MRGSDLPGRIQLLAVLMAMNSLPVAAAEWSATPGLNITAHHNDNVTMRSSNELSSAGYSVTPRLDLAGREENWDMNMRTVVRSTRYRDLDNADSDNYFFNLGGGYNTETQRFGLATSFTRNNTYDTDYDTQLPGAQLVDDHTERETTQFTPYWTWQMTETGTLDVSLISQDVEYDEVTTLSYKDYQIDTAQIRSIWNLTSRSQLGFSLQYQMYTSEKFPFTYQGQSFEDYTEFDNQSYRMEYTYQLSESSRFDASLGKRRTTTTFHSQAVGCLASLGTICLLYEIGDVEITDDGADLALEYSHSNEVSSFQVSLSRMVQPASFGGAQEIDKVVLNYKYSWSERIKSRILLEAFETTSIDGLDAANDRERYRIEPRLSWKLAKDWQLDLSYRHISQTLTQTGVDSQSNMFIVGLNMTWPKLFSTF